jgi:hypothetical protein
MCESNYELEFLLESTLQEGGEGVIVQRFGSKYERGRSPVLFKFKVRLIFLLDLSFEYFSNYSFKYFLSIISKTKLITVVRRGQGGNSTCSGRRQLSGTEIVCIFKSPIKN